MKKNKLILFDWGNIVESHQTHYSVKEAWNDLLRSCGNANTNEVTIETISKYCLSAISDESKLIEAFYSLKKDLNMTVDYEEYKEKYKYYFDQVSYYKDVKDYEISLKDKCYIGVLSNLLLYDKERIDKQLGLSNYDYVFLSFELGCRKPDIEIFEKVQKQLPFSKEDILLVDDRTDNIETAKKFGWNTFQATGLELEKIKEACTKFVEE